MDRKFLIEEATEKAIDHIKERSLEYQENVDFEEWLLYVDKTLWDTYQIEITQEEENEIIEQMRKWV